MDIYELKIKIYLLKDIKINEAQNYLAYFIEMCIRDSDNIESSKINLVLTKHNIKINQIYYQKQDLESYFLEKIGG